MVANIESDERPHVEYLRTALSELRARTLLGEDASTQLPGHVVIDRIFERQLRGLASSRPREQREQVRASIHAELKSHPGGEELARRFDRLDTGWVFPRADDEKLNLLLATA